LVFKQEMTDTQRLKSWVIIKMHLQIQMHSVMNQDIILLITCIIQIRVIKIYS